VLKSDKTILGIYIKDNVWGYRFRVQGKDDQRGQNDSPLGLEYHSLQASISAMWTAVLATGSTYCYTSTLRQVPEGL